MCARNHPSDDDREPPRGLADALARWDTEQGWMRSTPGRDADSTEHVPPPESTPAQLSPPADRRRPTPPPVVDSWDALVSRDPQPPRSVDPWAPAPAAAEAEQELWTPPGDPVYRAIHRPQVPRPRPSAGRRRPRLPRAAPTPSTEPPAALRQCHRRRRTGRRRRTRSGPRLNRLARSAGSGRRPIRRPVAPRGRRTTMGRVWRGSSSRTPAWTAERLAGVLPAGPCATTVVFPPAGTSCRPVKLIAPKPVAYRGPPRRGRRRPVVVRGRRSRERRRRPGRLR